MFDNELTWLCIAAGIVIATSIIMGSKVEIAKEETKRIELQLKVNSISTNKVDK